MYDHKGSISSAFHHLLLEISKKKENESADPTSFFSIFETKHNKYRGFRQHDSQEFLRILLEDISNEHNLVSFPLKYQEFLKRNNNKKELNSNYHKYFLDRENSFVVDLFYSQICNTFSCSKCYNNSYTFEKVVDIPLLIGIIFVIKIVKYIVTSQIWFLIILREKASNSKPNVKSVVQKEVITNPQKLQFSLKY